MREAMFKRGASPLAYVFRRFAALAANTFIAGMRESGLVFLPQRHRGHRVTQRNSILPLVCVFRHFVALEME